MGSQWTLMEMPVWSPRGLKPSDNYFRVVNIKMGLKP